MTGGTKTWLPAEPAFLTLTPKAAENPVTDRPEDAHCVQAHDTDAFLNPNETVHFIVTDAVPPGAPVEKQGHADTQTTWRYLHHRSRAGEAKLLEESFATREPKDPRRSRLTAESPRP